MKMHFMSKNFTFWHDNIYCYELLKTAQLDCHKNGQNYPSVLRTSSAAELISPVPDREKVGFYMQMRSAFVPIQDNAILRSVKNR